MQNIKTFELKKILGKSYNKYHKKFRFESRNIVDCFKSQYVEMIVRKKLTNSE